MRIVTQGLHGQAQPVGYFGHGQLPGTCPNQAQDLSVGLLNQGSAVPEVVVDDVVVAGCLLVDPREPMPERLNVRSVQAMEPVLRFRRWIPGHDEVPFADREIGPSLIREERPERVSNLLLLAGLERIRVALDLVDDVAAIASRGSVEDVDPAITPRRRDPHGIGAFSVHEHRDDGFDVATVEPRPLNSAHSRTMSLRGPSSPLVALIKEAYRDMGAEAASACLAATWSL